MLGGGSVDVHECLFTVGLRVRSFCPNSISLCFKHFAAMLRSPWRHARELVATFIVVRGAEFWNAVSGLVVVALFGQARFRARHHFVLFSWPKVLWAPS